MSEGAELNKEHEEDVKEDLELADEDAEQVVGGGTSELLNLSATGKHIQK